MKTRPSRSPLTGFIILSWLIAILPILWLPLEASRSLLGDIKIAAERGDPEAQEELGDAHMSRMDGAQAELWYRKAAQAGRRSAQAKLGNRLLMRSRMGIGLDATTREKLGQEALPWIRLAAQQGVARAQADLASVLYEGKLASQESGSLRLS